MKPKPGIEEKELRDQIAEETYQYLSEDELRLDREIKQHLADKNNTAPDEFIYAFYKSQKDGHPANGGKGTIAEVGAIHEVKGPLQICTDRALHATLSLNDWDGDALWLVKMYRPWQRESSEFEYYYYMQYYKRKFLKYCEELINDKRRGRETERKNDYARASST